MSASSSFILREVISLPTETGFKQGRLRSENPLRSRSQILTPKFSNTGFFLITVSELHRICLSTGGVQQTWSKEVKMHNGAADAWPDFYLQRDSALILTRLLPPINAPISINPMNCNLGLTPTSCRSGSRKGVSVPCQSRFPDFTDTDQLPRFL